MSDMKNQKGEKEGLNLRGSRPFPQDIPIIGPDTNQGHHPASAPVVQGGGKIHVT
ncbi:MAG: hypothetical protein NVS1B10_07450 [Candidatus Saccharimonadales bacterium]